MTEHELINKLDILRKEYEASRLELHKAYADAHNLVQTGDLVTDHISTVKVMKIGYSFSHITKQMGVCV